MRFEIRRRHQQYQIKRPHPTTAPTVEAKPVASPAAASIAARRKNLFVMVIGVPRSEDLN